MRWSLAVTLVVGGLVDRIRDSGRPLTVVRVPGADHSLRNPDTGERPDYWPQMREWLMGLRVIIQ